MRAQRLLHFLLPAFILAVLLAGGFSCNLITGPHRSSGPDTTSSNFAWTVDTIGASGSYLYDVSIVNDTLAYAVGSINLQSGFYNVARWNGTTWSFFTLKGFPPGSGGDSAYGAGSAVFANSARDVWIVAGFVFHFDGNTWTVFYNTGAEDANKIWSSGANDLWCVGISGMIVHYTNGYWQRVQSGTTLPFQDIWGDGGQVLAVASDKFGFGGQYIVQLNGDVATHIEDTVQASVGLSGIWFVSNQKYFIVGNGIYEADSVQNGGSWNGPFIPLNWFSFAVRGQATNDVIVAGELASLSHFNGKSWTGFSSLLNTSVRLQSVAIKNNLVIAVGFIHNDAQRLYYGVAYIGRR